MSASWSAPKPADTQLAATGTITCYLGQNIVPVIVSEGDRIWNAVLLPARRGDSVDEHRNRCRWWCQQRWAVGDGVGRRGDQERVSAAAHFLSHLCGSGLWKDFLIRPNSLNPTTFSFSFSVGSVWIQRIWEKKKARYLRKQKKRKKRKHFSIDFFLDWRKKNQLCHLCLDQQEKLW